MSKLSEPFYPDKSKSSAEQLDDIFNHMRLQLDFLCWAMERILKYCGNNNDSGNGGGVV